MKTLIGLTAWPRASTLAGSAMLVLACSMATTAQGQPGSGCNTPDDCLPPQDSDYAGQFHSFPGGLTILGPIHDLFTSCDPPPKHGRTTVHEMSSRFRGTVPTPGGALPFEDLEVPVTVKVVFGGHEKGGVRVFDTEILSMDISGAVGGVPVMIRESPTLPSIGQTRIDHIPGGMFHIDSFFDVFTELSLDGGQTWLPSQGPTRMVACQANR